MHRYPLRLLAVLSSLAIAGCTTAGNVQPPSPTVAAGPRAGIAITRPAELLYYGAPATVEVNGQQVANLSAGESYSGSVRPGPTTITVSNWSSPGHSSYRFNAAAGKTYRFQVKPRSANLMAGFAAGFVGQVIEGGGPFALGPLP